MCYVSLICIRFVLFKEHARQQYVVPSWKYMMLINSRQYSVCGAVSVIMESSWLLKKKRKSITINDKWIPKKWPICICAVKRPDHFLLFGEEKTTFYILTSSFSTSSCQWRRRERLHGVLLQNQRLPGPVSPALQADVCLRWLWEGLLCGPRWDCCPSVPLTHSHARNGNERLERCVNCRAY